jgi:hypothetical protein
MEICSVTVHFPSFFLRALSFIYILKPIPLLWFS